MPRPGAFAANFTPDTLNRFRDLCNQQARQYTKVLERLAEIYLETGGEVLEGSIAVESLIDRIEKLEKSVFGGV